MEQSQEHLIAYPARLASLSGVRVLCNLSVMFFHWSAMGILVLMQNFYDDDVYDLLKHPAKNTAVNAGLFGVDVLLIITGFLAAYSLIPVLQASGSWQGTRRRVLQYYVNRAARILPAMWAAVGLTVLATSRMSDADMDPITTQPWKSPEHKVVFHKIMSPFCPAAWPNDLLMVTNYNIPFHCVIQAWSLDVQMVFWVVFPLLLVALQPQANRFFTRVSACMAGLMALATFNRVKIIATSPEPVLPVPLLGLPWDPQVHHRMALYPGQLYFTTHTRLTSLASGVLVALAVLHNQKLRQASKQSLTSQAIKPEDSSHEEEHGANNNVKQTKKTPKMCLVPSLRLMAAAATVVTYSVSHTIFLGSVGESGGYSVAQCLWNDLLSPFGPVTSVCTAYLLYCLLCSEDVFSRVAAAMLSSRHWSWPALLSYSAYLVHALVMVSMFSFVIPEGVKLSFSNPIMWYYTAVYVVLSYGAAAVLHFALERPAAVWMKVMFKKAMAAHDFSGGSGVNKTKAQ